MAVAATEEVVAALGPWVLDVEHIGSTAVPGLAAKPVIDLMVGVRSLDDSPAIIVAVEGLGYEYGPEFEIEVPSRRYFRRYVDDVRTHQIHLVERTDTAWWDRHVAFRDWLRIHDDDRDTYAALKRRLAVEHRHDRAAYTDANPTSSTPSKPAPRPSDRSGTCRLRRVASVRFQNRDQGSPAA